MRLTIASIFLLAAFAAACSGDDNDSPSLDIRAFCGAAKTLDVNIRSRDVTPLGIAANTPDIIEASGIAASRRDDDILWVHNDSGDEARFFAIDRTTGEQLATFSLEGVTAIDWEDMAIRSQGRSDAIHVYDFYLADIGDNAAQRQDVKVYAITEPEVIDSATPIDSPMTAFQTITLRYPDHPHDAETFMVDPETGDMIIVTKELATGVSLVFRAPASATSGSATTLEEVGQIDFKSLRSSFVPGPNASVLVAGVPFLPTGGDISPDGSLLIIRTYGTIWLWTRPEGAPAWEAFSGSPAELPSETEQQGEAIAFDADGGGYTTVSEGSNPPLHHFRAQAGAACETPAP